MENINNEQINYSNFYEDKSANSKNQEKSFKIESVSSLTNNRNYSNYIHYLCQKCNTVPKISILDNFKLKVECKCKDLSNKDILLKEFSKYLIDKKSFKKENFKCKIHKKNIIFIVSIAKKIFAFIVKEK